MTVVTLYGKPGCCLCDEAKEAIRTVRLDQEFELREAVAGLGVPVWVPPLELCTDNAAMIAGAARFGRPLPYPEYLSLDAEARAA